MLETSGNLHATLTEVGGQTTEYLPAAIIMFEGEQYIVMRAEVGSLVREEVLLLRIEQGDAGARLCVVEDQRPFAKILEDTLGITNVVH